MTWLLSLRRCNNAGKLESGAWRFGTGRWGRRTPRINRGGGVLFLDFGCVLDWVLLVWPGRRIVRRGQLACNRVVGTQRQLGAWKCGRLDSACRCKCLGTDGVHWLRAVTEACKCCLRR